MTDQGSAAPAIDTDDGVEMLAEVDDDRFPHGLPCQAGAAPAWEHGKTKLYASLDRGQDVVVVPGNDDGERQNLVAGGVGAVEQPRGQVEVNAGGAVLAQVGGEGFKSIIHDGCLAL